MKSFNVVLIFMFLIGVSTIFAQNADSKGNLCDAEANRQFDFWIGEWSIKQKILKANGKWFEADAETKVMPAIDGCALVENWSGEVLFFWEGMKTPEKIKGFSIRSFNPKTQKWVINWMDTRNPQFNSFEGNFADGKGEFFRTIKPAEGKETIARITFSDVAKTSVLWELAISSDDKKNWQTLWIMEMKRKPVESFPSATDRPEDERQCSGRSIVSV